MTQDQLITSIELQFLDIDKKLTEIVHKLELNASNVVNKIEKCYTFKPALIRNEFNLKRNDLLNKLNLSLKQILKKSQNNTTDDDVYFTDSNLCITKIGTSILGRMRYVNDFDILKKFLYIHLFNFFTEIEISNQIEFFYLKVFNECKLFAYSKTTNSIKIINYKCEELNSKQIDANLTYKSIFCFEPNIAALYQHSVTKKYFLIIYDQYLNMISYKSFKSDLNLCSFHSDQVVCWLRNEHKIIVLDHFLNEIIEYGQDLNINDPFYFCDSIYNNGILLDVSETKILFYFFILDEPNQHKIKILNRKTGLLDGTIELLENNVSNRLIRFDSKSNIVMKSMSDNMINLYDSNGKFLLKKTTNQFIELVRFDLNKYDEIICYNRGQNKIVFF
jgi:hypothetical protein